MKNKRCVKCNHLKPISEFYNSKLSYCVDGKDYYCKYCRLGTSIKSQRSKSKKCSVELCENPHYAKSWCRTHYERVNRNGTTQNKNKVIKDDIYYFEGKKHHTKEYVLNYKYKMGIKEFKRRSAKGCELCGDKPERTLHVDHDHNCCSGQRTCGKCVRGIICNRCNKAVDKYEKGLIRADYPNLKNIIKYVNKYSKLISDRMVSNDKEQGNG